MRKRGFGTRALACFLSLMLLLSCMPVVAAQTADYTGPVLMAFNADRYSAGASFATDREPSEETVEAAGELEESRMLPDGIPDEPEPLSGPQALLRQAEVGDVEPQAAAHYSVGDTKRIYSHYAESEGKEYRQVDMICTSTGEMATIWREKGTQDKHAENDARLAAELDERLPAELELFGDKRVDTDGDGKIAVFLYEIDCDRVGGYFSTVDLMDRIGRIGPVWHPIRSVSNHMDCIHVQGESSYSFIVQTCLHEYQHYIHASYRFVGHNNFNVLDAAESFINEGFSTSVEYLLAGNDRYSGSFDSAAKPSSGLSLLYWSGEYGNYSMAFVFTQYLRTRYAAMTDDLDSEIPGSGIFKTILEARTPKNDNDSLALVAGLLYPQSVYPDLADDEARCQQLLYDFWLAVFLQEPEGAHGFNGESWAKNIDLQYLVDDMPEGETDYPIRGGMAAFYQIVTNDTDTVRITRSDDELQFTALPQAGFTLHYDANGGTDAPQAQIMEKVYWIGTAPTRSGYTFTGWALTPDASAPQYNTGNRITLTEDTTLYAVWQPSAIVETDTQITMSRQGNERRRTYRFVPETDGVYKLTCSIKTLYWTMELLSGGEYVDTLYENRQRDNASFYYRLEGGTAYDLYWNIDSDIRNAGTFSIVRQDVWYTLTYRSDHPLFETEWSCSGDTVYTVEEYEYRMTPRFVGWAYTPDAQTPDVNVGDSLTLTQDTTLYAVFMPETPLPTDGSEAHDETAGYMRSLFVLRPEQDGMYELRWQTTDASENEDSYNYGELLDAQGDLLLNVDAGAAQTVALRAGETYYLCSETVRPSVTATCKKVSDRITASLTLSVGKKACFDLKLRDKTTYTIPDYTPAALDGRQFIGWKSEQRWENYAPGDTIVIAADTVLTAQWSDAPQTQSARTSALLRVPIQVLRALCQNVYLRVVDRFTR